MRTGIVVGIGANRHDGITRPPWHRDCGREPHIHESCRPAGERQQIVLGVFLDAKDPVRIAQVHAIANKRLRQRLHKRRQGRRQVQVGLVPGIIVGIADIALGDGHRIVFPNADPTGARKIRNPIDPIGESARRANLARARHFHPRAGKSPIAIANPEFQVGDVVFLRRRQAKARPIVGNPGALGESVAIGVIG